MKNVYRIICVVLVMMIAARAAAAKKDKGADVAPPTAANVAYGSNERQVLDFWKAEGDGPRPLLVVIHGGGWIHGDKNDLVPVYHHFLKQGISIAAMNYRFTTTDPMPAPILDAARAVQFIRSKAAEWNIDPKRVAAAGFSAGANTALWLATHEDLADPNSADPVARQSTRLCGAAVSSAQTTIEPDKIRDWVSEKAVGHAAIRTAGGFSSNEEMFKAIAEKPEVARLYAEYSPINHLSKDDPPLLLEYGSYPPGKEQNIHGSNFGIKFKEKADALGIGTVYLSVRDDDRNTGFPGGKDEFILSVLK